MNREHHPTIPLDSRDGGALNWFEYLDEDFRVPITFTGKAWPNTSKQQESWLIDQLREETQQRFFFATLAHKGLKLDFNMTKSKAMIFGDLFHTSGTVPLAQLFQLPNIKPREELDAMKTFLTWIDQQLDGQGQDGRDATIQWFRGGYRSRGIEAAGFVDKEKAKKLNVALEELRAQQPWLEDWYQRNMMGLARVRLGPHCWFSINSLGPDRFWAKICKEHEIKKVVGRAKP